MSDSLSRSFLVAFDALLEVHRELDQAPTPIGHRSEAFSRLDALIAEFGYIEDLVIRPEQPPRFVVTERAE